MVKTGDESMVDPREPRPQRAIGLEIERQELLRAFKASQISTPLAASTSVQINDHWETALASLRRGGFDQAPVSSKRAWVGWVSAKSLEARGGDDRVKSAFHPLSSTAIVSERASISEVLPHLARVGFVFTASGSGLVGFVTPSDLERHAARNHFFVMIAGIEILLSELARVWYSLESIEGMISAHPMLEAGPKDGDYRAPESLKERYLLAKEKHSETHPVEYLTLGQLMDLVVSAGDEGRIRDWEPSLSVDLEKVVKLRPDIAHPTRSLTSRRTARELNDIAEAAQRAHLALGGYLLGASI